MSFEALKQTKPMKAIFKFQNSFFYIIAVALIVLASHLLGLDLVGFGLITLIVVFTLVFNDDGLPFTVPLFFVIYAVSAKNSPKNSHYYTSTVFVVCVAIMAVLILSAFVFKFVKDKLYKKFFTGTRLTAGFICLSVALLLNGIFFKEYRLMNLVIGMSYVFSFFIIYLYLYHTVKWNKTSLIYFAKTCFVGGLVISVQLLAFYLKLPVDQIINKDAIHIGWALSNHIGATLFLMMPFGFYLAYKSKHPSPYMLLTGAMMIAIVFTLSRATLLFALPIFVTGVIFCCIDSKNKLENIICAAFYLVAAIIIFIVKNDAIMEQLRFFLEVGLDDRGRYEVWLGGLEAFTKSPFFGVGFMHKYKTTFFAFYFYHNTPIQYLVSCGIVGLGAYIFHRIQTVMVFVKKPTVDRLFLAAAFFGILGISLLDNPMMNWYTLFYYSAILVFAERDLEHMLLTAKNGLKNEVQPVNLSGDVAIVGNADVKIFEEQTSQESTPQEQISKKQTPKERTERNGKEQNSDK